MTPAMLCYNSKKKKTNITHSSTLKPQPPSWEAVCGASQT